MYKGMSWVDMDVALRTGRAVGMCHVQGCAWLARASCKGARAATPRLLNLHAGAGTDGRSLP